MKTIHQLAAFVALTISSLGYAEQPSKKVFDVLLDTQGKSLTVFDDLDNGKIDQVYLWYMPNNFEVNLDAFKFTYLGAKANVELEFFGLMPQILRDGIEALKKKAAERYNRNVDSVFVFPLKAYETTFKPAPIARKLFENELFAPEDGFDTEFPLQFYGELSFLNRNQFVAIAKQGLTLGSIQGEVVFYKGDDLTESVKFSAPLAFRDLPPCKLSPNGC